MTTTMDIWHKRLGHTFGDKLNNFLSNSFFDKCVFVPMQNIIDFPY